MKLNQNIALAYLCRGFGFFLIVVSSVVFLGWFTGREYLRPYISFYWIFLPILTGFVGANVLRLGRQLLSRAKGKTLADDSHPPVLYLRAFDVDARMATRIGNRFLSMTGLYTEEEQFVDALGYIGPVIAIGRPREFLPQVGASREYVSNEHWQERVLELMRKARAVVIVTIGDSSSLEWEIDRAYELLRPEQLILVRPFAHIQSTAMRPKKAGSKAGVIGGFRYYSADWEPHDLCIEKPPILKRSVFKAKVSWFVQTLLPVFQNLSLDIAPPRVRFWNPIISFFVVLIASFPAFIGTALLLGWMNLLNGDAPRWTNEKYAIGANFPENPEHRSPGKFYTDDYSVWLDYAVGSAVCSIEAKKLDDPLGPADTFPDLLAGLIDELKIPTIDKETVEQKFVIHESGWPALHFSFNFVGDENSLWRAKGFILIRGTTFVKVSVRYEATLNNASVDGLLNFLDSFAVLDFKGQRVVRPKKME